MLTKRHKNINNKTKKNRFTGKSVPQLIENVYIKNDSQMDNEKRLACFLANNNKIKIFAVKTLYFMLNYWKNYNHTDWESLVKQSLIENIDGHIIIKIGFSESEVKTIVEMINNSEKKKFFAYLDDKFLKVTAVLNSLSEPEYTIYHVDFNKTLQKTFIKELEKIMMIKSIKWTVIKNIYDSLKNKKERNMYNFFIFDVIYAADKSIDSIYRNNLGNMNFFRERLNSFNHNKSNYIQVNECNKSVIDDDDYLKYGIYNSTERYKISKNTPYAKIMDKFNKRCLGGPSGSTSLMYIMLFHFYKYPFTYQNKILLLGLLISDYIPLWHTIPEILLSAYPEFNDKKIPKYTLDKDSVLYSIKLLNSFIQ
jgi:hypothetical protein